MAHYDEVLDLGFDYGAVGGLSWNTQVIPYPNGRTRRNQLQSNAIGRWQLGNRELDGDKLGTLDAFLHAMRGRAHTFLYKDWNDFRAVEEQIVVDGSSTSQLIKTYGISINGWVRSITKPKPDSVVIEYDDGGGFSQLTESTDYTLDDSTGVLTWLLDPLPDSPDQMRWSGEFYVRARFDRDVLDAEFLAAENRDGQVFAAYHIGGLAVIEEPEA